MPTEAVADYLRARRNDGRLKITEVLVDLLAGDAHLGQPSHWERTIMGVGRGRPEVFGYDRDKKEIWLAPTADELPRPKARPERKGSMARPPRSLDDTQNSLTIIRMGIPSKVFGRTSSSI